MILSDDTAGTTDTKGNADVIARFDEEYNAYHNVSRQRRVESVRVLREFQEHAGCPLVEVDADAFKSYIATLVEKGYQLGTVRKRAHMIRPFYAWAWESKLISAERYMEVKAVRLPRGAGATAHGRPRPYSRDEIGKLWADLEKQHPFQENEAMFTRFMNGTSRFRVIKHHALRLQTEAMIALALFGALRRDEVLRATADDVDPLNAYIIVRGAAKNEAGEHRIRHVPWTTPDMKRMVGDWIAFRSWLEPDHEGLWLSLHNQGHYRNPLVKRRFRATLTNLGRGWQFHRLRHTAITEMLRAGYPIQQVKEIAGHAKIQQTLAYAEIIPDDLIKTALRQSDELSSALSPKVAA